MLPLWRRRGAAARGLQALPPARAGKALRRVAPRAVGHVEHDAPVREVDLYPVEKRQAVHAEQQRRAFVETERGEGGSVGEGHRQVVDKIGREACRERGWQYV